MGHLEERDRAVASIMSVFWLMGDRYDEFVRGQKPSRRLPRELWTQLRSFGLWDDIGENELHGILIFLVVRGLGRAKKFQDLVPSLKRPSPETSLLEVIKAMPEMLPSLGTLDGTSLQLIRDALHLNSKFKFAQFIQGGIAPLNVMFLKEEAVTSATSW